MESQPFEIESYETGEIDTSALADGFFADAAAAHDDYAAMSDASWDLWNAATDAWLAGDIDAAYALTTASIEVDSLSDQSWNTWNDSFATAQDLQYGDYSYATSSVDAGWSAADTSSWSAASTASYSAVDTSSTWSAADTSGWSASAE